MPHWGAFGLLQAARAALPEEIIVPPSLEHSGIHFLCENLQVTGSYKVRAVCHWLGQRRAEEPPVALASSGNFAVALAWAGRRFGLDVTAVMMERSHPWKVERVRQLGGKILVCGNSTEERTRTLESLQMQGYEILEHLNDPRVLVGHATLGLDLAVQRPRRVLVPASTGGLLAATALALKQFDPEVQVIGVQPQGACAMALSFRQRAMCRIDSVDTECDALTANHPGPLPLQLALELVDDMATVSEASIRRAVRWLAEELKLVVEPGAAVGLAALQSGEIEPQEGTWVVLSGGNLAPARLARWLAE